MPPRTGKTPAIMFVCNELGSFRRHREHLPQAVMQGGWRAILLATPVGERDGLDYEFRPIRIERFRFHPVLDFLLFATVLRVLIMERPAALHLINLKPYLYGGLAAALARILGWRGKLVITVPGLGRLHDVAPGRIGPAHIRRYVVERLLRIATLTAQVTFETEYDRDVWIERGLIERRQATVTHGAGIDLAVFSPRRRPHGDRSLRALFAGRLLRSKGLEVFLETAALLRGSQVEMLVAGFIEDDPDAVPLDRLRNNENIRFLGVVSRMADLLRDVDVVVLPSCYNEGIPRILIEAAACACVPVATRFAGSQMLITDEETGFFLVSTDPDAQAKHLAGLILKLRDDAAKRRLVGRKAAEHVRSKGFAAQEVANAFLRLYVTGGAGNALRI